MILCIDSGNTRVKWGVTDGDAWLARGAVPQGDLPALLSAIDAAPACQRVRLANVAGDVVLRALQQAMEERRLPCECLLSAAVANGVVNHYRHPERLGVDRWCALIGARALHAGPALVVMAGTATTVDTLDGDGHFLGGMILPGIELMRRALGQGTAGLPVMPGAHCDFPRCTEDAIHSGILESQLGALERAYRRLPGAGGLCLLSGGNAARLAAALSVPCRQVDNLVLEGLRVGAQAA